MIVMVMLLMTKFIHSEEQVIKPEPKFINHINFSVSYSVKGNHALEFHDSYKGFTFSRPNRPRFRHPRTRRETFTEHFEGSYDDHAEYVPYHFSAYCDVFVHPVLGFLGITGNVFTGMILKRSGLEKPTNVLLLALAISSISCLLPTVNIFSMLRHFDKRVPNMLYIWEYEPGKSGFAYFCFHATRVIAVQSRYGRKVTSSICVLIAVERLVVVFSPMRIKRIVTLKKTVTMVIFVHLLWLPFSIIDFRSSVAHDVYYAETETFGLFFEFERDKIFKNMAPLADWLSSILPVTFIVTCIVAMSVKLRFILQNRRRLASSLSGTQSLRVSKTLIVTCVTFCLFHMTEFFHLFKTFSASEDRVLGKIILLLDYVDSASHLFVFIFLNTNFRTIIVKLIKNENVNRTAK